MLLQLLIIIGALALLIGGAEFLVRGSVRIAVGLGMTPLVAGLTVAAFGTSSPELVVSVGAAFDGRGDLAMGNIIGSNIGNIALVLGISALIRPLKVERQIVRMDIPVMVVAVLVLVVMLWDGYIGRFEGAILVSGLIYYTFRTIRVAKKSGSGEGHPAGPPKLIHYGMVVAGLGLLVFGGMTFVNSATLIARELGVSEAVIGLTMVAVGTSLPEMATSIIAAIRKESDVAIGNVVGSCIFNVLGILGIAALLAPMAVPEIGVRDLVVLIFVSLVVLPMVRTGFVLNRVEGGLLLAGYIAYVYWLYSVG